MREEKKEFIIVFLCIAIVFAFLMVPVVNWWVNVLQAHAQQTVTPEWQSDESYQGVGMAVTKDSYTETVKYCGDNCQQIQITATVPENACNACVEACGLENGTCRMGCYVDYCIK